MTPEAAFQKAIAITGSIAALARKIGIARQAVSQWNRVPAERAYAVEQATEGVVRCHELRPDVFPAPRKKVRS